MAMQKISQGDQESPNYTTSNISQRQQPKQTQSYSNPATRGWLGKGRSLGFKAFPRRASPPDGPIRRGREGRGMSSGRINERHHSCKHGDGETRGKMASSALLGFLAFTLPLGLHETKRNSLAVQFSAPGNFVIGGMFAFHSEVKYSPHGGEPRMPTCESFYILGYQRHLAMRFAIAEINNSTTLLPGVTLGYEIHDTCNNVLVATKPAISFLSETAGGNGVKAQCNYTSYKPRVVAVVGPADSDVTVVVAQILNFLSIPEVRMISFASSSANLSDRQIYPSFFRTVPSDKTQAQAMVHLLIKFGWNWVAALATDDKYGRQALEVFIQLALTKDMCVAYEAILPSRLDDKARRNDLNTIVRQLKKSLINATVVFAQPRKAEELLNVVIEQGVRGKVWIASECWATSPTTALIRNLGQIGTILGMAVKGGGMPGFPEYVRRILADPGPNLNSAMTDTENEPCPECRNLTIADFATTLAYPRFRTAFNTYKAVYAIAHALHSLLRCNVTNRTCDTNRDVYPWQLVTEVSRVNFTIGDQQVFFSKWGDAPTGYDLVLWEWAPHSGHEFVSIGSYNARRDTLSVNESKIRWRTEDGNLSTQVYSTLHFQLVKGERMGFVVRQPLGDQGPNDCKPCPKHQWSLPLSTTCQDRVVEYLEVSDLLAVIMVALTILALTQMAIVTGILAKHRHTPAMRYIGGTPTLLITLSSASLCTSFFFFVIKPTLDICQLRQPFFFLSFTVTLATVLAKVIQSSGLDRALPRPWLRNNLTALSVLLNTAVQGLLCLLWFLWNPPSLEENTELARTILLQCQDSQFPGFGLLLAYDILITAVCCVCAYTGPDSKKENKATKSISFAMVLVLIIWTLFVPTYSTSQGKFVALFQVFAGLASIFATFGFFYYPVCYIMLFAPHMNTDTHFSSLPQKPSAEPKPDTAEPRS
ncbi:taste receptor type 1 member 1-like [Hemicordylus capensis]|uniref:taste receptor type 1 member 1-like n=1 Tax=Hemicordylus capensis TaxID=884348 RepID=UPI0023047F3F|nr:taste receptor type 1 member 1-like [Hemicordylus capensis]